MLLPKEFEIGIPDIDEQHQELLTVIERLEEACAAGCGREELLDLIDFMGTYTTQHFVLEERLISEAGFPGAAEHKALHEAFIRQYQNLRNATITGVNPQTICKAIEVLFAWVSEHILSADRAALEYVKSAGLTMP